MPDLIDLHVHTSESDGSDSPFDIVKMASTLKIGAIAITDHDTVSGVSMAKTAGCELNVIVIAGCEISCTSQYGEVHILGLWMPDKSKKMDEKLDYLQLRRKVRNERLIDLLRENGMPIEMEELKQYALGASIGRPHIASAMVKHEYVRSKNEAFANWLGSNGRVFVPLESYSPMEAVDFLKDIGATSVLAHPMLIKCPELWRENLVEKLASNGLDAIEVYHSEHSQKDERYLLDLANRFHLAISGGSDYHGRGKPEIRLGHGRGSLRVPKFVLDKLIRKREDAHLPV